MQDAVRPTTHTNHPTSDSTKHTYHPPGGAYAVHVDAVGVGPVVLAGLDQAVRQLLRNVVEIDELLYARLFFVELFRALIQA